jgi:chaperonin cofactor prefoldin
MKAKITSAVKEGERIRVSVAFEDGSETSYLKELTTTKDEIETEIKAMLRRKEEETERANDLASKLINMEIE